MLRLTFSYPVVPSLMQSALRLGERGAAGRQLRVAPCGASAWQSWGCGAAGSRLGAPPAGTAAMALETCCLNVTLVPGLRPRELATLYLPEGARYHPRAGARRARSALLYLHGLRRFRLPLRDDFQQLANASEEFEGDHAVTYRALTLWLPHGLARGGALRDLARQMQLCKYADPYKWASRCENVAFELQSINKGKLRMRVPGLLPRQHYRLQVRGSDKVRLIDTMCRLRASTCASLTPCSVPHCTWYQCKHARPANPLTSPAPCCLLARRSKTALGCRWNTVRPSFSQQSWGLPPPAPRSRRQETSWS